MICRFCAWHKPAPILLELIEDGKPGVIRTDGICPDCEKAFRRELESRRSAGGGSTSFSSPRSIYQNRSRLEQEKKC